MAERKKGRSRRPWSERFSEPVAEMMLSFNASIGFDRRLAVYDLRVSAAHARMLAKTGIISRRDADAILRGLKKIGAQIEAGRFRWKTADEDVHTAIERRLIALVGEAGGRLHTARSRNDQVATDIRLWLKDAGCQLRRELALLRRALLAQARRHARTIMPGMTHLQVAQPTTFGHHLHAHECAFARDSGRLADALRRADVLPLGSAALAGTSFAIDRRMVARELGFASVSENTADAVASRDFAVEAASACAILMVNLSRLCEEIVVWSSQGFGLVSVADAYCTGSSIMPQKRNPDAAELIRGKSGRVTGHVLALAMMSKGQPLAYNKDSQEDKEALFDCFDTTVACVRVAAGMIATLQVDRKAMAAMAEEGFATATDLADLLVGRGVPFRRAHGMVAAAVRAAADAGCRLADLPAAHLRRICNLGPDEVRAVLPAAAAVRARSHYGAPAPEQLRARLAEAAREVAGELARLKRSERR